MARDVAAVGMGRAAIEPVSACGSADNGVSSPMSSDGTAVVMNGEHVTTPTSSPKRGASTGSLAEHWVVEVVLADPLP